MNAATSAESDEAITTGAITTGRIHWDESRYRGWYGSVGPYRQLFSITWSARLRAAPGWVMKSTLPGLEGRKGASGDDAVLKVKAEEWLAEFVTSLGAVFPEERGKANGNG
jgi:hypothetical protein